MGEIHLGAWLILSTQAVTLLGAVVSLIVAIRNGRAVKELKVNVDGRLSNLLELTASSSHAEGKLEGVAQEKSDVKAASGNGG